MEFEEWLSELRAHFAEWGHAGYIEESGMECWRQAYDDDRTPEQAFDDEMDAIAVSQ